MNSNIPVDFSSSYVRWWRRCRRSTSIPVRRLRFDECLLNQNALPCYTGAQIRLEDLWNCVQRFGGSRRVSEGRLWATVGRQFNPPSTMTNFSHRIKQIYAQYLLEYERVRCLLSSRLRCCVEHRSRSCNAFDPQNAKTAQETSS